MRKYTIVGYLVDPRRNDELLKKIEPIQNFEIYKDSNCEVGCFFLNDNMGHFYVMANELSKTYLLANLLIGYYTIYKGWARHNNFIVEKLVEMNEIPDINYSLDDLISNLSEEKKENIFEDFKIGFNAGTVINLETIDYLRDFIELCVNNYDLALALENLILSRELFNGFMVDSYRETHYSREIEEMSEYEFEKAYYENRAQCELAFVSSFKSIEFLLGQNNIKKNQVLKILKESKYCILKEDLRYELRFNPGEAKFIETSELIKEYIDLRNITSAHGNIKPPKEKIIHFYSVYEIQKFISQLIYIAVISRGIEENKRNNRFSIVETYDEGADVL